MIFEQSARVQELSERLQTFMDAHIYPNEALYDEQALAGGWDSNPANPGRFTPR